jgi:hypothetical protein
VNVSAVKVRGRGRVSKQYTRSRAEPYGEVEVIMNYPAASHEVSTGKIRSKGEASFGELNPPMGD